MGQEFYQDSVGQLLCSTGHRLQSGSHLWTGGRRVQDGFMLVSVDLSGGMAGGLGSARTVSYWDSSKVISEYLDFLRGISGHLGKVFLERGSRNCHSLMPETGTLSLLLDCIDEAITQHRFKEQRCRFYLFRGQGQKICTHLYEKFYLLHILKLILQTKKPKFRKDK